MKVLSDGFPAGSGKSLILGEVKHKIKAHEALIVVGAVLKEVRGRVPAMCLWQHAAPRRTSPSPTLRAARRMLGT